MRNYDKDNKGLKIYKWMYQALDLSRELAYYYAVVFKKTGEGLHEAVIDIEEFKFWTGDKDTKAVLKNLKTLAKNDLISIDSVDEHFVFKIKHAARPIFVNYEDQDKITRELKSKPDGMLLAVIYLELVVLSRFNDDLIYIEKSIPVKDSLAEILDEDPKNVETALKILKEMDAIDY